MKISIHCQRRKLMRTQTTVNPDKEMKVPHCMKKIGTKLVLCDKNFCNSLHERNNDCVWFWKLKWLSISMQPTVKLCLGLHCVTMEYFEILLLIWVINAEFFMRKWNTDNTMGLWNWVSILRDVKWLHWKNKQLFLQKQKSSESFLIMWILN